MPEVTLSEGDTKNIYSGDKGDILYCNTDGDIRFSKHGRVARSGRLVQADNSFEIELKQDEEDVFVHAEEDDVTVEYELQGFSISLFSRQITYRPTDKATQNDNLVFASDITYTVAANSTETQLIIRDTQISSPIWLEQSSISFASGQPFVNDVTFAVRVIDADTGDVKRDHSWMPQGGGIVNFSPAIIQNPGETSQWEFHNNSSSAVDLRLGIAIRTD